MELEKFSDFDILSYKKTKIFDDIILQKLLYFYLQFLVFALINYASPITFNDVFYLGLRI